MKQDHPRLSWGYLCGLFGKTRHAHYDHLWRSQHDSIKAEIILQLVYEIRRSLPRLGTRKMLFLLKPQLASHHIEAGRDYLFDLFDAHKLLIRQPFFTTKPTGEGTGLGLSLSYDIVVKGHGGKIEANTKEGEFTAFIVLLPFV